MKKTIVILSILLFVFACAFIYANSFNKEEKQTTAISASDTLNSKPCAHHNDSTKCQKHEACKKDGSSPCCKKHSN